MYQKQIEKREVLLSGRMQAGKAVHVGFELLPAAAPSAEPSIHRGEVGTHSWCSG